MRGVSSEYLRAAALTGLLVTAVPAAWADDKVRVLPPVGVTSQVRVGPAGGAATPPASSAAAPAEQKSGFALLMLRLRALLESVAG